MEERVMDDATIRARLADGTGIKRHCSVSYCCVLLNADLILYFSLFSPLLPFVLVVFEIIGDFALLPKFLFYCITIEPYFTHNPHFYHTPQAG
jgi:hypothetical protein